METSRDPDQVLFPTEADSKTSHLECTYDQERKASLDSRYNKLDTTVSELEVQTQSRVLDILQKQRLY